MKLKNIPFIIGALFLALSCDLILELDKGGKVPATSVIVNGGNDLTLVEGLSNEVEVVVLPENTTDNEYVWASSDENIAKAEKLTVYAIAPGEAELTLKVGAVSATLKVVVNAKAPEISTEEMVDLGLSVKWASCNVGATTPEEYGKYFAWGETTQRDEKYTLGLYKFLEYDFSTASYEATKYNFDPSYGVIDGKVILDPEDDAATVALGGNWRMPTYDEMRELRMGCRWDSAEYNGVAGFKVTGPSGKSIFIPSGGAIDLNGDYNSRKYVGANIFLWTKQWQPGGSHTPNHHYAYAYNDTQGTYGGILSYIIDPRYCGFNVRAVNGPAVRNPMVISGFPCEKIKQSAVSLQVRHFIHPASGETVNSYGVCYAIGSEPTIDSDKAEGVLDGNVVITDIKNLVPGKEYNMKFYAVIDGKAYYDDLVVKEYPAVSAMVTTGELIKSTSTEARVGATFDLSTACFDNAEFYVCYGASANPEIGGTKSVCEGSGAEKGQALYKATVSGLTAGQTYHYRACLKVDNNIIYGDDKTFKAEEYGLSQVVDLGLSVKWAAWNLGAEVPEEKGSFFAWGDTAPKTEFGRPNNAYFNSTLGKYTKYTESTDEGTVVDHLRVLELCDDAARVQWGGSWRTPSAQEYVELFNTDNTTVEVTTYNGVDGFKITSKKAGFEGKWIFFPNTGYYRGGYSSNVVDYASTYPIMMTSGKSSHSNGTYYITGAKLYPHAMEPARGMLETLLVNRWNGYAIRAVCE